MSAELNLQAAIFSALLGNNTLLSRLASPTSIYDNVPEVVDAGDNTFFPYVTIGDDTSVQFDDECTNGHEITATIHTWSRHRGRKEAKEIMGLIYDTLHKTELVVLGYNTLLVLYEFSSTEKDPDGITIHGVQRFRIILTEE